MLILLVVRVNITVMRLDRTTLVRVVIMKIVVSAKVIVVREREHVGVRVKVRVRVRARVKVGGRVREAA